MQASRRYFIIYWSACKMLSEKICQNSKILSKLSWTALNQQKQVYTELFSEESFKESLKFIFIKKIHS